MTNPEQKLTEYRAKIDAIDAKLAQLLLDRCAVVREVAYLKRAHWPADCHIRNGREGKMHRAIAERFQGTDIAPGVALAIWRQLIGASTQMESPLCIATLATQPHHGWLAREYFGAGAKIIAQPSLQAMRMSIAQSQCNIAVLPPPTLTSTAMESSWYEAEMLHQSGFMLFARLPVSTQPLPNESLGAFAFAAITPEASGDDVSYFLRDKKVEIVDGFHTARDRAVYLGSHPQPISVPEE